jgi:hypothetical protein
MEEMVARMRKRERSTIEGGRLTRALPRLRIRAMNDLA